MTAPEKAPEPVPDVLIDLPADVNARPFQIACLHRWWGVEVLYREKPHHAWQSIASIGGDFEIHTPQDIGRLDEVRNDAPLRCLSDSA